MRHIPRSHLIGGAATALLLTASACGTGGPGEADSDVLHVWALEDAAVNPIVEEGIAAFDASSETTTELTTYVNDAYKQKLQVALGSPQAPDVFFNWGGGNLAQYVEAGQVAPLDEHLDAAPEVRDAFLPSVLDVGKVDGDQYGVPMLGVQPVVLFHNKAVFEDAGVEPPETYDDLLSLVDTFQDEGITPITLPGAQGWTELMWLEYLTDRIGGEDLFAGIAAGEDGAWSDPALLEALAECRELAESGAFGDDFSSIDYDNGSASTLLASGESAMMLMGTWELATQRDRNPEFVEAGDLGSTAFPSYEGGDGDPASIVGNPSNFFSVNANSGNEQAAMDFLTETVTSDEYVDGLIEAGQVPAVEGVEDSLATGDDGDFTTFTYDLVAEAPHFTQSWDQALDPAVAETMLTSLQLVFLGDMSPEEFADTMERAQ